MSNFEFLKNTKEYALFAPAVMEAERVYASANVRGRMQKGIGIGGKMGLFCG